MNKKINELVGENLAKSKQNVDLLLKNYTTMVGVLSSDYQLINGLHLINKTDEDLIIQEKVKEITEQLYLSSFSYSEIQSITIVTKDHNIIPYFKKNISFSPILYKPICDEAKKVATTIGGALPYGSVNQEESSIYIARRIMDLNTLEYLGTIIVCIDPKAIYHLFYHYDTSVYATSFIISSENQIIISYKQDDQGQYVSQEQMQQAINNKIQQHSMPLRYFKWELVYMVDRALVMKELNRLEYILLFLSIGFLIVLIMSIVIVSDRFTKPIPNLIKGMKEVQKGNFNIRVPISSNNEIGNIEETFNYMTSTIHQLMEENTGQYKKLLMATQKTKEAEIRALEAQINPHFLYNTLDSINWMAIEKEEYEISLMLSNLAKILRYTISNIHCVVSVKDEIDWLNQYLYLQKQRFVSVFDYEIEAEVNVYQYKIHKLLLQPLIENAIIHGFEGYKNGGLLKIIFEVIKNDYIKIQIQDNGKGMDEDIIKKIENFLVQSDLDYSTQSIGIANVIYRVKSYYGEKGKIFVKSNQDGTIFTLMLPMIREEAERC